MTKDLFSDAANIAQFMALVKGFRQVEGWLDPGDGYLLYRLARDGEGQGAIVEIGSWMGLSTAWLATGSKEAGREHVHAIDVFDGGPTLKDNDVIRDEGTTYHHFTGNLEKLGLFDYVEPTIAESSAAAQRWTGGAIRLLFIDGDHRYAAVKQDFDLWSPHVAVGGYVVLDDAIETYPGVLQVFNEALADPEHWQHVMRARNSETLRRIA
jgi:predicted O-methyltransferase YrrM